VLLPRFVRQFLWQRRLIPSAAAIFLACIVTVYSGLNVVVFVRGADRAGEALGNLTDRKSSDATLKTFIDNWKNTVGVADAARRLSLGVVQAETPDDNAAIEAALSNILENSPVSDTVWQQLAQIRLMRSAATDTVLAAFRMSDLTGSHEGGAMVARGLFGLEHWTDLPESDRHVVVRDVLATIGLEFRPQKQYRQVLAAKSELERDDILAAFTASGRATPELIQALSGSRDQD